jgi:hypothetical protein
MKNFIFCISMVFAGLSGQTQITAPAPSPLSKIEQKVGLATINVEYSRPSKKDRIVFGDIVPYGKMWRTGANASTKITFSEDVTVEGTKLAKGTYALFTVPGDKEWSVIFYSDFNVSGVPENYDITKEAANVKVIPELIPYTVETFLIDINELRNDRATIQLIWETTLVPVKIRLETDAKVMANIDKVLGGPSSNDFYLAARYYYDQGKDLNIALGWIKKANAMDAKFWKLRVESLILAKLGMKTEAIEAANKSKAMAILENNDEYVKMNDESIREWSK